MKLHKEVLFKTCDLGSIGNFVKAAEFAQMAGILEKDKGKGIQGDRKNFLDNKSSI